MLLICAGISLATEIGEMIPNGSRVISLRNKVLDLLLRKYANLLKILPIANARFEFQIFEESNSDCAICNLFEARYAPPF